MKNDSVNENPMILEEKKLLVKHINEYLNKMGYYAHNIELHYNTDRIDL